MKAVNRPHRTIRAARASEAEQLSDLAFRSKASWGYPETFMEACRGELTYTAEQIASEGFYFAVAETAGTCAGFYALALLSSVEAELEALFVEPQHLGKGFGYALIEHAKREAARRGVRSLIVQGDPNAEDFYRAAGGVLIGRRASASIEGRYLPLFTIDLSVSHDMQRKTRS